MDIDNYQVHIRVHIHNTSAWDLGLDNLLGVFPLHHIAARCVGPACRAVRMHDYSWKFVSPFDTQHITDKPAMFCPVHAATFKTDE